MKLGTKSLLFGVHQFLWHPYCVLRGWLALYGRPTWRELLCIVVHDWGYWGSADIDGPEGEKHPIRSARIVDRLFKTDFTSAHALSVLLHSRSTAKQFGTDPSPLCWADKMSPVYDPDWFFLLRAQLSGEIHEFRRTGSCGIQFEGVRGPLGWLRVSAADRERRRLWIAALVAECERQALQFQHPTIASLIAQ